MGDQLSDVYIELEQLLWFPWLVQWDGFGRFRFFPGMEEIKTASSSAPQVQERAVPPDGTEPHSPRHSGRIETALERLYTQAEVAKHFAVTSRTVENWRASGLLPFIRLRGVIRIKERDLAILIERRRVDGRGQR